jgi:cytochrome c oxidase cbb3-type subunit IV
MLKFIKHHMASIDGIAIYPIISFLIFFIFFVVVTVWVYAQKKAYYDTIAKSPLEDDLSKNHNR